MRISIIFAAVALVCAVDTPAPAATPADTLHVAGNIPGPDGRWDLAAWDNAHRVLLVAHGDDVLVVDPSTSAVRSIGTVAGAHAAVPIPGTDHVLVTSGRDDSVRILDLASGQQLAAIAVGTKPDAAIVSQDGRRAYVMDAGGGAVSVLDLARMLEVTRIALKTGLELPVLVNRTTVAVNNEDRSEIEIADLMTRKQAGAIPLTGCEGPTGLAIDPATHLSLSSCANGKAALVDLARRRLIGLVDIGAGPDTVIWDSAHQRFLVPCGRSGNLSIIKVVGGKAVSVASMTTEISARTAAIDPASGRIYLPAARFGPPVPNARPSPLSGTFHILVLAPDRP